LSRLKIVDETSDLVLHFDNGARVDIINSSFGYEGWQAGYVAGGIETNIIGCGGAEIAVAQSHSGR